MGLAIQDRMVLPRIWVDEMLHGGTKPLVGEATVVRESDLIEVDLVLSRDPLVLACDRTNARDRAFRPGETRVVLDRRADLEVDLKTDQVEMACPSNVPGVRAGLATEKSDPRGVGLR